MASLLSPDNRNRQTLLWLALAAVFIWLLFELTPILAPFLLAAVLAYICNPLVERLARLRVPRTLAVVLVMIGLLTAFVLLLLIIAPLVQKEAALLATRLPGMVTALNDQLAPWLALHFGLKLQFDAATLRQLLTDNWDSAQSIMTKLLASLKIGGMALVGLLANLLLAPVVMFFLLRDWHNILGRVNRLIPLPWQEKILRIVRDIDAVLAEFLRGQLLVMLLLAAYYSSGLSLAGVEFALPIGILTGLLVFIPYLGFAGGLILALIVAALQFQGWTPVIAVLVVFGIGQLLESFLLTPFIVGERIGLHPLAVIFALMAFGQLFGFFGILLALPASAALLVGLRETHAVYLKSKLYRG